MLVKPVGYKSVIFEKGVFGLKERPISPKVEVFVGKPRGNYIPARGPLVDEDGRDFKLIPKEILSTPNVKTEVTLDITDANVSMLWEFGGEDLWTVAENGTLKLKPGASIWVTFEEDKKGQEGKKVSKLIVDISTTKPEGKSSAVKLFIPPNENTFVAMDYRGLPPTFGDSLQYFNWLFSNYEKI